MKSAERNSTQTVAAHFEEQARRHPTRVAIQAAQQHITYEALNQTANRLARTIQSAAPEAVPQVALLYDQGSWLAIAAMLAILKAGRVYVPLDPAYPRARTQYMLEHSQAGLVLCSANHLTLAEELARGCARVINSEALDAGLSDSNLDAHAAADSPAYILYTSGSTGRPKGVVQTHRNLLHFVGSYARQLGISPGDRLTFFYSYSFSASLMDIYGALLHGATLLPFSLQDQGITSLAEWLADERITVFHSVPTVFRNFVNSLTPDLRVPSLRAIDLGGEPVYKQDVELFKRHFQPPCVLINHLAFTEASVSAQYPITHDTEIAGSLAPVGWDAEGVKLLLLDENDEEVQPGEPGEIVVESTFLSPGYWQDEEMSQAAFRRLPGRGEVRCYHTGDLGRRLSNGLLEHLGRKDSRVKIRGHSIELAEVEQALLGCEGVQAAVVAARPDGSGNLRLAAYYVAARDQDPSIAELRTRLRQTLPDYMLPSAFQRLPELPLTATGKVDRRALPAPVWHERNVRTPFIAPRSSEESALARIWCDVLGIKELGVQDDFFELGGDSLLAFQLLLAVGKEFGVELQPSILAAAPTIEQLVSALRERSTSAGQATPVVALQPDGSRLPLFLIPPAGKTVLIFRDLARHIGNEQPLFAFRHRGLENSEAPHETVEEMADYFIRAVRELQPEGPYLLGGMCFGATIAFEMVRQLRAMGEEVGVLIVLDEIPPGFKRPATGGWAPGLQRFARRLWFQLWNGSLYRNVKRRLKQSRRAKLPLQIERVWRTHRQARLNYRPQPLDAAIHLFVTSEWQKDTEWIAAWRKLTTVGLRVFQVPGGHGQESESFIAEPHVPVWSPLLADCLAQTGRDHRPPRRDASVASLPS